MANGFFTNPGNLSGTEIFRSAGNLGGYNNKGVISKKEDKNNLYMKPFRTASNSGDNFFRSAGDLSINNDVVTVTQKDGLTEKEIDEYLLSVVSGEKYPYECELGTLCGGGCKVVNFMELKQMVQDGYNIVRAKTININTIEVEFQQFRKVDNRERRR